MHCTLLVSSLLLPSEYGDEPARDLQLPSLDTLLARGNIVTRPTLECGEWLCRAFGVAKQHDWPVAALTLKADGVDPGHDYWLRADPVRLSVDRGQLAMAGSVADLTAAEARELVAVLNGYFSDSGLSIHAPTPQRWYLRSARAPALVTTPLAHVMHRDLNRHLPRGDDALEWHRVINEAQMVLHSHAVNAAREERGAATVNSLWLWGGGNLPAVTRPHFEAVWSNDGLARALAAAADMPHDALPAGCAAWLDATHARDSHYLLVYGRLGDALLTHGPAAWREEIALFDRSWLSPLLDAVRSQTVASIALVADSQTNLLEAKLSARGLWRFWRRTRPLASYADAA